MGTHQLGTHQLGFKRVKLCGYTYELSLIALATCSVYNIFIYTSQAALCHIFP